MDDKTGKLEQGEIQPLRPIDLLLNHFKHLPAVDELIDSPERARDFMAAVSKYANEEEFAGRTFKPPRSLADFPKEVAMNYSLSTHNTAYRIPHAISVDFVRGEGVHKLICVRFGGSGRYNQ